MSTYNNNRFTPGNKSNLRLFINQEFIKHPINEINQQQLVDYLMKENSEFKQLMMEQNKHMLELAKNAGNHNTNIITCKKC